MESFHLFFNFSDSFSTPTLAFVEKSKGNPDKSKGFSLCRTPQILGKGRKNAQKSKENRKVKQGNPGLKAPGTHFQLHS